MSDNKEHCQPVAYCAPDKNGLPNFGKGWCFSKLKNEQATMPLYAAAQPVVLTDEQPDYELHCDGEFAASASGKNAHLDILHYAAQYAQDGEIEIFKVTRTKIDPSILAAKEQANG